MKSVLMCMRILSDFLGRVYLPASQTTPIRTSDVEIERVVQRVVKHVQETRSRNSDNISEEEISARSHGLIRLSLTA